MQVATELRPQARRLLKHSNSYDEWIVTPNARSFRADINNLLRLGWLLLSTGCIALYTLQCIGFNDLKAKHFPFLVSAVDDAVGHHRKALTSPAATCSWLLHTRKVQQPAFSLCKYTLSLFGSARSDGLAVEVGDTLVNKREGTVQVKELGWPSLIIPWLICPALGDVTAVVLTLSSTKERHTDVAVALLWSDLGACLLPMHRGPSPHRCSSTFALRVLHLFALAYCVDMRILDWADGLYVLSDDNKMLRGCNLETTAGQSHHLVGFVQGSHAAATTARAAAEERTAQMAAGRAAVMAAEEARGRGLALLGEAANHLEEARVVNAQAAASLSAANVSGMKVTRVSTVPLTATQLRAEESVLATAQRTAAESAERASQAAADEASARAIIDAATGGAQEARAAVEAAAAWKVSQQGRRMQLKVVRRPNMTQQDSTEWFNGGNVVAFLLEASADEYMYAGKHSADPARMRNLQQVPDASEKSDHGFVSEDESSSDGNFYGDSAAANFFLDSSAQVSRNDASDRTGSSSESGSSGDD